MKTLLFICFSFFLVPKKAFADSVPVAVAANFAEAAQELATQYKKQSGHDLVITSGATGKFYAQITNGAPFEVFLSADQETPKKLMQEKQAVEGSEFTYAIGRLALWSAQGGYVDAKGEILKHPRFKHLAVADAKLAPYGKAAEETLRYLKLYEQIYLRIVTGENIGQTYQFVKTGNAELGFVAFSQVKSSHPAGSYWLVPAEMYRPIAQDAVLLKKGVSHKAARQFLDFLKTNAQAKLIMEKYGYLSDLVK